MPFGKRFSQTENILKNKIGDFLKKIWKNAVAKNYEGHPLVPYSFEDTVNHTHKTFIAYSRLLHNAVLNNT